MGQEEGVCRGSGGGLEGVRSRAYLRGFLYQIDKKCTHSNVKVVKGAHTVK